MNWKTMVIFDHTHQKIIESTFSFLEFVPACKKLVYSVYFWDKVNFRVLSPDWPHPFLTIFFPKALALPCSTSYGFLEPCQNSEKSNDPIPRKHPGRWQDEMTDPISLDPSSYRQVSHKYNCSRLVF